MTVVHTYFYIVVDTQRGCHTLKKCFIIHYIKDCTRTITIHQPYIIFVLATYILIPRNGRMMNTSHETIRRKLFSPN